MSFRSEASCGERVWLSRFSLRPFQVEVYCIFLAATHATRTCLHVVGSGLVISLSRTRSNACDSPFDVAEFAIYIQQKEPLEPEQQQLMIRIAVAIRMIVVVAA